MQSHYPVSIKRQFLFAYVIIWLKKRIVGKLSVNNERISIIKFLSKRKNNRIDLTLLKFEIREKFLQI